MKVRLAIDGLRFGSFALGLEAEAVVGPAADERVYVGDDGIDVLDIFLGRVGVIHAEVALAGIFAGDAEIEADGLGVADVQVAVGLGRETRDDLGVTLFRDMLRDDVADEIARGRRGGLGVLNGHNAANCGTDGREATMQFRKKPVGRPASDALKIL